MKSKTYYGEYSLMHWVNMMLSGDITLPNYQRSFVWHEKDIKRMLKSVHENQFVQPVTIALHPDELSNSKRNLILDGQQRLTSVLLAYLGYMPDLSNFAKDDTLSSGDYSAVEEAVKPASAIKWTFRTIFDKDPQKNSVEQIRARLSSDDKYKELTIDGFVFNGDRESAIQAYLKERFLGFSYVVPATTDSKEIQNGYTRLFRNINYFGKRLTPLASRRSLYYTNADYKNFFEGLTEQGENILNNVRIKESMDFNTIDFVRYLSTLSQYHRDGHPANILKYYSAYSSRESYFADYVSYLLLLDQEDNTTKFDGFDFNTVFQNGVWKERYSNIKAATERLKAEWELEVKEGKSAFTSWIDVDYWLFGLVYHLLFQGKQLNEDIVGLISNIKTKIEEKKDPDTGYPKTPNTLTNLRNRITESISIYAHYVH